VKYKASAIAISTEEGMKAVSSETELWARIFDSQRAAISQPSNFHIKPHLRILLPD
jgi:hypothetical protein